MSNLFNKFVETVYDVVKPKSFVVVVRTNREIMYVKTDDGHYHFVDDVSKATVFEKSDADTYVKRVDNFFRDELIDVSKYNIRRASA